MKTRLLPLHKTLVLLLFSIFFSLLAQAQTTRYVRPTATGNGSGADWENASANLQAMINAAGTSRVFVAVGTYSAPAVGFRMKNNVAIYGGFDPEDNITNLGHIRIRPTATSGSILSGNYANRVIENNFTAATPLMRTAILDGFTLTNGSSEVSGAGMYNYYASPNISNCTITGNTSNENGGGVFNGNSSSIFTNVAITGNTATRDGGGVFNQNSAPIFTNVTITGNTATRDGGGVFNQNSAPIFTNVTITGNTATIGVAIYNGGGSVSTITNSIVLGTSTGLGSANVSYSLVQGINNTDNNNVNASGVTPANVFGTADDGLALKVGSPALNMGNNAAVTKNVDMAGRPRIRNNSVDLGAYEYQDGNTIFVVEPAANIVYVKEGGLGTGDSWDNAIGDLNAVLTADNADIKQVFVAIGTYPAPVGGFKMKNNVAIYGGFNPEQGITNIGHARIRPTATGGSILSGNGTGRVVHNIFTAANPLTPTAVLDGFTLTNGSSDRAAGMYNYYASPSINNCAIIANMATSTTADAYGAGVLNDKNSSPVFTNVLIAGNKATANTNFAVGAGVYNRDFSNPVFTNVLITDNTVSSNTTANAQGGGIYNRDSSNPVFTNVTITGNIGTTGSQMYNHTTGTYAFTIKNSIIISPDVNSVANLVATNVSYSMVQGITGGTNNNINVAAAADVFFNAINPTGADGIFGTADDGLKLKTGSPVLDMGDNTAVTKNTDLAGQPRTRNNSVDLGAYELQEGTLAPAAIVYVKAGSSGSGDSWDDALGNPFDAVLISDYRDIKQIFVAVGTYAAPATGFKMRNDVAIYGGFHPEGSITNLSHARIRPTATSGSILSGNGMGRVVYNDFTVDAPLTYTAVLDGFTISNGSASHGAGVYNNYASPTISNCAIIANMATSTTADAYGAGVLNDNSSPVFTNVLIAGNSATTASGNFGVGGGIYNRNSHPVFTNVLITDNGVSSNTTANAQGGGIYNRNNSNPVFTNVTITGNTGTTGSQMYNHTTGTYAFTIKNSIIISPDVNSVANLVATNVSYSMVQGITGGTNNNINVAAATDVFVNTTNPAGADGIFGTADDGLVLKTGSPALNMGNNAAVNRNVDMTGQPRIRNNSVDLGAYEYQEGNTITAIVPTANIVYVKEGGLGTGDSWDNAIGDLNAVLTADNTDIKQVFVAVGTYIAPSGGFKMKNDVAIYGGFNPALGITNLSHDRIRPTATGGSILSGNDMGVVHNDFTAAAPLTHTAVLDGFTLTNGSWYGGVYNNYASPSISNCAIIDNATAFNGGGVSNSNSSPIFTNVVIVGNTATFGGGVSNYYSSPIFTNVVIVGNIATHYGGSVYNDNSSLVFTNVTITSNAAGIPSSTAIYNRGTSAPTITNSLVLGTSANLVAANVSYSLVQGINNTTNNNIDATDITPEAIFLDVHNPVGADGIFGTLDDGLTLIGTSPALNMGSNTLFTGLTASTKDLAGNPRVYDLTNGGLIDLGAYEYQDAPTTTLPVQFGSFTVIKQHNSAKLQWNTLSESNNKEFVVSRSSDGITFTELARIAGSGTVNSAKTYFYTDLSPLSGINYYRLQQIDTDGKTEVLGEKALNFGLAPLSLSAYPNPSSNIVNLTFAAGVFNRLQVADLSGRTLETLNVGPSSGSTVVNLGNYPAGIYMLSLSGTSGTETIKVVKK